MRLVWDVFLPEENIASGQGSPDEVMNSWMNSEGHRANILSSDFTQVGIACYYDPNTSYKYHWVQLFINEHGIILKYV